MSWLDRETMILLAGVLIGTGSTIAATANGWGIPASFLISGVVLVVASAIIEMRKR